MADKQYVVSGAAAVVPTNDGSERYLYRGGTFTAEQSTEDGIKHLLSVGLIAEVKAGKKASSDAEVSVPEGDPAEAWTVPQLDAWAARQQPALEFKASDSKPEKLAAIAALIEARKS